MSAKQRLGVARAPAWRRRLSAHERLGVRCYNDNVQQQQSAMAATAQLHAPVISGSLPDFIHGDPYRLS